MSFSLSIRKQLLLGFGSILLLLILMIGISLQKMAGIQGELDVMMNNRYPKVEDANRLVRNMLENSNLMLEAMQKATPEDAKAVLARMDKNIKLNNEIFGRFDATVKAPGGLELLKKLHKDRQAVRIALLNLIPYIEQNRYSEAQTAYDAFVPVTEEFLKNVIAFANYQAEEMRQRQHEAGENYASTRMVLWILGSLSLIAGLAIALLLSTRMSRRLSLAVEISRKIADGDFSHHRQLPTSRHHDEIQQLLEAQEAMRAGLATAMQDIRRNAEQVAIAANQLSGVSQQVAGSAQRQADSTSSAAATLEQLTVSINHVADNAGDASQQANQAGSLAEQGSRDVGHSVTRIAVVNQHVTDTAGQIDALTGEVQAIGNIVTVIRDVADQTNLLALNAAIEAARAGESGRGFAVVADEVRKLAERTTISAEEITRMIASIQQNASRVVARMEQSRQSVGEVTASASNSALAMQQVQQSATGVLAAISHINHALTEQRSAGQGLSRDMETVARMAEENSRTVGELADSSQQLQQLSDALRKVVDRFRI